MAVLDWNYPDFFPHRDTEATGKTLPSLERSRHKRKEFLTLFDGDLPQSIMVATKESRGDSDTMTTGSYTASETKTDEHAFKHSRKGVRGGKGKFDRALSAFPQNIGRAILLLYTEPGQTVLDVFAGHNSRMQLCVENSRHYVGYDISSKFMAMNEEIRQKLALKYPMVGVKLHCCDSRRLQYTRDEFAHFTITSPPYYSIEYYGNEPEQLGSAPTYEEFLSELAQVMRENYRVLKRGSYCVWFVNDFRLKGRFHPFHMDTMRLLCNAGFVPHDTLVVDLGVPFGLSFLQTTIERRIIPKRHEYGIVVRKP